MKPIRKSAPTASRAQARRCTEPSQKGFGVYREEKVGH